MKVELITEGKRVAYEGRRLDANGKPVIGRGNVSKVEQTKRGVRVTVVDPKHPRGQITVHATKIRSVK